MIWIFLPWNISFISQPLWIHYITLWGCTAWKTGRILGCVPGFPLCLLLSPTGAWQRFTSRTRVSKSTAKHSGASTLKLQPLHLCRKFSAPVNSLFPSVHSVTNSGFTWHPPALELSRIYKFTENGCDTEWPFLQSKWPWMRGFLCNPTLLFLDSTILSYSPKVNSPCDLRVWGGFRGLATLLKA